MYANALGKLHVRGVAVQDGYSRFATLAAGTDIFNRLFSNDIEPVRTIRGLGMSLVNKIGPARRFFMRQAGGDTGDPPKLLRGERLDAA